MRVANAEDGLAISSGDVVGRTFIHKFGAAPDFDTGDNEVYVWDGADDAGIDQMTYTFSTTADIDSLVSPTIGETQNIEIQGLDGNYLEVTQTLALNGQTRVPLTTPLLRVHRMVNRGSTDIALKVYCYVDGALTAGVPDNKADIRAVIINGTNQTEMAIYTVPAGKTAYLRGWFASSAGGRKTTNYIMRLKVRPLGEVFQLKHRSALTDGDAIHHKYTEPLPFAEKTDIIMTAQITEAVITESSIAAGFDLVLQDN